jgi:hypothetical protein
MALSSLYPNTLWQDYHSLARRSLIMALAASILGFFILYASIVVNGVANALAPIVVVAGVPLLIMAWRDWESGIRILLVIVIVEGALRKWFLQSASEFVYFYKDFLMIVVIFSYVTKKHKPPLAIKGQFKFFPVILFAFALYAVASISNPALPHPLVGLLGAKAYLLYVPLAFLVPRMFTTREKLVAFMKWYLIISLFVTALCAMQFLDSDPNSSLNRYAWDEKTMASAGLGTLDVVARFQDSAEKDFVRVTGPFSYLSGLGVYLTTTFGLLLGLISQRRMGPLPKGFRWLYHICLAVVATATFMTGSRSAVLNLCFMGLIFYAMVSKKDLLRRIRQAVVGGALIFITLTALFPQVYDALYTRTFAGEEQISEGRGRIEEAVRLPIDEAAYAGAFGYGIGATQNAVPILMSKLNLPFVGEKIPIYYESESGRLMLELGIVGYILHLFLRLGIFFMILRACFSIRDVESRSLAIAAVAALIFPLFIGGAVTNHTQNVYQWFLIGIPMAMINAQRLADSIADQGSQLSLSSRKVTV